MVDTLEARRCPHGKRADDYCADCFFAGEMTCEKCAASMRDAVAVIDPQPRARGKDNRMVTLVGWRCPSCLHVNPDPLAKIDR